MISTRTFAHLALLTVAASSVGGCGYSTESMYPTNVKTVYVEMFNRGKNVYRRGLEMRLTEALVKQIEATAGAGYKVVKKATADTMLSGSLNTVEQRVLSFNPDTGNPNELEVTFVVSFAWTDLRNEGKVLCQRANFRAAATYIPPGPINEDFFEGSEDLINRIARLIVEQLETEW